MMVTKGPPAPTSRHILWSRFSPLPAVAGGGCSITAIRLEGVEPSLAPSAWAVGGALPGLEIIATLHDEDTARLWRWIRDAEAFAPDGRQLWRLSLAPMSGPVLRDAALAVGGGKILAIGNPLQVIAAYPAARVHKFDDTILLPGPDGPSAQVSTKAGELHSAFRDRYLRSELPESR